MEMLPKSKLVKVRELVFDLGLLDPKVWVLSLCPQGQQTG